MKHFFVRFFCFISILFIIDSLISGFDIEGLTSYLVFAFLLTATYMLLEPLIRFFTLPVNLVSLGAFNFVLGCFYIYFFKLIVPGFIIQDGSLGPLFNKEIQLPEIKLSYIAVIILSSLSITLLNNIVTWALESKGK